MMDRTAYRTRAAFLQTGCEECGLSPVESVLGLPALGVCGVLLIQLGRICGLGGFQVPKHRPVDVGLFLQHFQGLHCPFETRYAGIQDSQFGGCAGIRFEEFLTCRLLLRQGRYPPLHLAFPRFGLILIGGREFEFLPGGIDLFVIIQEIPCGCRILPQGFLVAGGLPGLILGLPGL